MSGRAVRRLERVSEAATGCDPSDAANASPRVTGTPLRPVSKAHPGDERLAVTLTVAELRELMRDAALEVLADSAHEAPPALLDRSGLARGLGVGMSTVDRWRKAGMPAVFVGDDPRFELARCLEWLRTERGRP